jgi:hypothetical protein
LNFIIICSYGNVTDVIDTVEHEGGEFRILTADEGLFQLFSDLYGVEHVIKLPILFGSFRNVTDFIHDIIRLSSYQKRLLRKCEQLNPSKIVFYYIGYNGFESWLIKKLCIDTKVYYRPKVNVEMIENNNSLKMRIKTFVVSHLYRIQFESSKYYGYPIITIGKSFLKKVHAQKYDHIFNTKNVIKFVKGKYSELNNIKVLLLVGGEYDLEIDEYSKKMYKLYCIITKYYDPHQIGIKNHPNFEKMEFEWSKNCVELPAKIPANLLCYNSKVVIGYGSATLYEAADIGVTAISIVKMITSTSKNHANETSKYLLDNSKSKNIDFPKDIDEFNNLLMNL